MASKKMKMLYLLKILKEKTDEEKGITIKEIISELDRYGINAERKSIYDDIEMINDAEYDFGFFIEKNKIGKNFEYKLVAREFEVSEIKFLVDSVLSSISLSKKSSKKLVKKLLSFASKKDASILEYQTMNLNSMKTANKAVDYTLDNIERAMKQNKRISFIYNIINKDKILAPKSDEKYIVSPWHTIQDDGKYYMVAYDEKSDILKTYRIDKMTETKIENLRRLGEDKYKKADVSQYTRTHFSMFSGDLKRITLICSNEMSNIVLERFGTDITVINIDDNKFKIVPLVYVSSKFFGWILSFGDKIKVEEPEDVKQEFINYLDGIYKLY